MSRLRPGADQLNGTVAWWQTFQSKEASAERVGQISGTAGSCASSFLINCMWTVVSIAWVQVAGLDSYGRRWPISPGKIWAPTRLKFNLQEEAEKLNRWRRLLLPMP